MEEKIYLIPEDAEAIIAYCTSLFINEEVALSCADAIILQVNFSSNLINSMPADQALAQTNAQAFKDGNGMGSATLYLSCLQSIALLNSSMLSSMLDTAKTLDTLSTKNEAYNTHLQLFQSVIENLQAQVASINPDNDSYLLKMKNHHDLYTNLLLLIKQDYTRFKTHLRTIKFDDKIANLTSELENLQQQYADNNEEIAKGASAHLSKDVLFGFDTTSDIMGGEINPEFVVGIGLKLVGEAQEISDYTDALSEKYNQQNDLRNQMANKVRNIEQLKQDTSGLCLMVAQINEFYNRTNNLINVAGSLIESLQNWRHNLETLLITNSPLYNNFFEKQVTAGITYWQHVYDQAKINMHRLSY